MSLNSLKELKLEYESNILNLIKKHFEDNFEIFKKSNLKKLTFSEGYDSSRYVYFDDNEGFEFHNEYTDEKIKIIISDTVDVLKFLTQNYNVDVDDSIVINDNEVVFNFANLKKINKPNKIKK